MALGGVDMTRYLAFPNALGGVLAGPMRVVGDVGDGTDARVGLVGITSTDALSESVSSDKTNGGVGGSIELIREGAVASARSRTSSKISKYRSMQIFMTPDNVVPSKLGRCIPGNGGRLALLAIIHI